MLSRSSTDCQLCAKLSSLNQVRGVLDVWALVLAIWFRSVSDLLEFLFSLLKWKWGDPCPEKRLSPDFLLQVIWNLQLMSMWEMALRPHLGSRMAWSLSLI